MSTGFDNTTGVRAEKEYLDQLLPLCPPGWLPPLIFQGSRREWQTQKEGSTVLFFTDPILPTPPPSESLVPSSCVSFTN